MTLKGLEPVVDLLESIDKKSVCIGKKSLQPIADIIGIQTTFGALALPEGEGWVREILNK